MAIKVAEIPFRKQKTTKQQHAATAYIIYYAQAHEGTPKRWRPHIPGRVQTGSRHNIEAVEK